MTKLIRRTAVSFELKRRILIKSLQGFYLGFLLALPSAFSLAQFGEDIDLDNDGIWDLNSGSGSGPWQLNERDIDLDNDGIWDLNQPRDRDLDNDGIWDLNVGDNDWDGEDNDTERGWLPIFLPERVREEVDPEGAAADTETSGDLRE